MKTTVLYNELPAIFADCCSPVAIPSGFDVQTPWREDLWIYATDGAIVVRMPLRAMSRESGWRSRLPFPIGEKRPRNPSRLFDQAGPWRRRRYVFNRNWADEFTGRPLCPDCGDCGGLALDCPGCGGVGRVAFSDTFDEIAPKTFIDTYYCQMLARHDATFQRSIWLAGPRRETETIRFRIGPVIEGMVKTILHRRRR